MTITRYWRLFKAWLASHSHLHLGEATTKAGLLVSAMASVLPNFAQFDVRIAYVAAACGVILVLIKSKPTDGK